jgi:hypothetical protein
LSEPKKIAVLKKVIPKGEFPTSYEHSRVVEELAKSLKR